MRGMPFDLPGKGALEAVAAQFFRAAEGEKGGTFWNCGAGHKRKKGEAVEPRSVLDHRRSPSPPTSTSTLSSPLGGGGSGNGGSGASTDTAGVAAVSHNLTDAGGRKEECAAELKPILGSLAADEWETMISESAASPGQEQTFLRWIMGDIDDPSKHQHHQLLQQQLSVSSQFPPVEFVPGIGGGLGFGLTDPRFGFEPIGGIGGATPVPALSATAIGASPLPASGGFSQTSSISFRNSRSSDLSQLPCGKDAIFGNPSSDMISPPFSLPPAMFLPEPNEEKPQFFAPNPPFQLRQQTQTPPNPAFFLPLPSFTTAPEQHQGPNLFLGRNYSPPNQSLISPQLHTVPSHLQQRPMRPRHLPSSDEAAAAAVTIQQEQQQALVDQLFNAAELIEAGNFVGAHGILARLNHQLPSPIGKPLLRSAYYFKEALILLLANSSNLQLSVASSPSNHHRTPFTTSLVTPLDVVLKLSANKAFSEVSPFLHFTNFTVTQTLLEELGTAGCIHIIDFDLGVGGQWSSFMQELGQRPVVPLLKITAFVSPCAFHPLELNLTKDNLSQFAADLKISFEINILSMESFDPAEILAVSAGSNEAIAVNLPAGAGIIPSFSTLLRLVKHLQPNIVVMVDQGCDRSDLSFYHHFLHAFQSSMILLDSIDAAGSNLDMANKIERFVLQPRIENCIIGRHRAAEKMLPWRTLFASAGFVPVQFSNFAETQAECLLKRVQVRGFHVEKRQASLCLYWQQGELVSVSAWRC